MKRGYIYIYRTCIRFDTWEIRTILPCLCIKYSSQISNKLESANIEKPPRSREISFLRSCLNLPCLFTEEISVQDIDLYPCTRIRAKEAARCRRWLIITHPPAEFILLEKVDGNLINGFVEGGRKRVSDFHRWKWPKTKQLRYIFIIMDGRRYLFSAFVKNGNS